jgi:predicted nucleic acid-binding protein
MRRKPDWRKARKIALDTTPIIYHLEDHPRYGPAVLPIFRWIEQGRCQAVTSALSFLEVLVQPYRVGDDERRVLLTGLLSTFPGLTWLHVDLAIADRAAALRARYNLRTPDAVQIAAALESGADLFLTNDGDFGRVEEIATLLVDEITPAV